MSGGRISRNQKHFNIVTKEQNKGTAAYYYEPTDRIARNEYKRRIQYSKQSQNEAKMQRRKKTTADINTNIHSHNANSNRAKQKKRSVQSQRAL